MTRVTATPEHPVLVFDGQCNFCNGYVNFIIDHDPQDRFRFVRAQTPAGRELLERHGQSADEMEGSVLVIGDQAFTRSTGWLRTMRLLGGVWLLTLAVTVIPRRIRDAAFLAFGRKRYVLFGKTEACRLPAPERAHRFLDEALLAGHGGGGAGAGLRAGAEGAR